MTNEEYQQKLNTLLDAVIEHEEITMFSLYSSDASCVFCAAWDGEKHSEACAVNIAKELKAAQVICTQTTQNSTIV